MGAETFWIPDDWFYEGEVHDDSCEECMTQCVESYDFDWGEKNHSLGACVETFPVPLYTDIEESHYCETCDWTYWFGLTFAEGHWTSVRQLRTCPACRGRGSDSCDCQRGRGEGSSGGHTGEVVWLAGDPLAEDAGSSAESPAADRNLIEGCLRRDPDYALVQDVQRRRTHALRSAMRHALASEVENEEQAERLLLLLVASGDPGAQEPLLSKIADPQRACDARFRLACLVLVEQSAAAVKRLRQLARDHGDHYARFFLGQLLDSLTSRGVEPLP